MITRAVLELKCDRKRSSAPDKTLRYTSLRKLRAYTMLPALNYYNSHVTFDRHKKKKKKKEKKKKVIIDYSQIDFSLHKRKNI